MMRLAPRRMWMSAGAGAGAGAVSASRSAARWYEKETRRVGCAGTVSGLVWGLVSGTAWCMKKAGIRKFTSAGIKRSKNPKKSMMPFCQTIRVVMSPKGLKDPPAFAATTMLMHARVTKRVLSPPTAMTTAHIKSAVVRLSATGEMQNASPPVIQKSARRPKPLRINQERKASNTCRSCMALM
jgi:hypothetical protein